MRFANAYAYFYAQGHPDAADSANAATAPVTDDAVIRVYDGAGYPISKTSRY